MTVPAPQYRGASGEIRPYVPVRDAEANLSADIRKLIGEASGHPVGSAPWWHAVSAAIEVSTEHHEREERYILPRYVASLSLSRRKELGRQWCAFMASWPFDGPGRGRKRGHGPEEG